MPKWFDIFISQSSASSPPRRYIAPFVLGAINPVVAVKEPVITAFPVYGKTDPPDVDTVITFPPESTARLAVAVPTNEEAAV